MKLTKKEIIETLEREFLAPYKQAPAISTKGEQLVPISQYFSLDRIKHFIEEGYSAGILEGEKRMLDKAIDSLNMIKVVASFYRCGQHKRLHHEIDEVLTSLQALKNN